MSTIGMSHSLVRMLSGWSIALASSPVVLADFSFRVMGGEADIEGTFFLGVKFFAMRPDFTARTFIPCVALCGAAMLGMPGLPESCCGAVGGDASGVFRLYS